MAYLKLLGAAIAFVWFWSWRLIRKDRLTTPAWEALDRLHDAPRVTVYDSKGRRICRAYRNPDGSIIMKLG